MLQYTQVGDCTNLNNSREKRAPTERSTSDIMRDNLRKHYPDFTDGQIDGLVREHLMYDSIT